MGSDNNTEQMVRIKEAVERVRGGLRVTKVVATRAVKTKRGDFFAGMSAAWSSVQDDASGPGADLDLTVDTAEVISSGMLMEDAKIAHLLVSMEASIGAYRAALSEGAITERDFEARVRDLKRNTLAHLSRLIPADEAETKVA